MPPCFTSAATKLKAWLRSRRSQLYRVLTDIAILNFSWLTSARAQQRLKHFWRTAATHLSHICAESAHMSARQDIFRSKSYIRKALFFFASSLSFANWIWPFNAYLDLHGEACNKLPLSDHNSLSHVDLQFKTFASESPHQISDLDRPFVLVRFPIAAAKFSIQPVFPQSRLQNHSEKSAGNSPRFSFKT